MVLKMLKPFEKFTFWVFPGMRALKNKLRFESTKEMMISIYLSKVKQLEAKSHFKVGCGL